MKTAHEILLNERITRLSQTEKTKQEQRLLAAAKASLVTPAVVPVLLITFFLGLKLVGAPVDDLRLYSGTGFFLLISLGNLVSVALRRERALRQLLREEAPELYAKLQN